jgi:hypothetical protein
VSRYDKYDPMSGGFRAPLAANVGYTASAPDKNHADLNKLFAVAENASGQIVKFGSAATAFAGVMILTRPMAAGDIVDVMTDGEIVELVDAEILAGDTLGAGQALFADVSTATGQLAATSAAGDFYVGRTVELTRLIVRCEFIARA